MEIVVVPKADSEVCVSPVGGYNMIGVSVVLQFNKRQIWKAKKRGKYWFLKGRGELMIRLTEAAMNRMFDRMPDYDRKVNTDN